jgi:stage II sporulation protein D
MLKPNVIPNREPVLNVGIVMPEDRFMSIEITVPVSPYYLLKKDAMTSQHLHQKQTVYFEVDGENLEVSIDDEFVGRSKSWIIEAAETMSLISRKYGLKVNSVIAGRSFHWKKTIDVYLPGSLEIRIVDGNLFLSNRVSLEQYLMCVTTSEMNAVCPTALIESQIIAARSWMLANIEMKHVKIGIDVCNDDCCQRYQGTTFLNNEVVQIASGTRGKVLMFADKICDARYSKCCGGITEAFENVFGNVPIPYLKSVVDCPDDFKHHDLPLTSEETVRDWIEASPRTFCNLENIPQEELIDYLADVDEEGEYFRWSFRYTQKEITALLNLKLDLDAQLILAIRPLRRGTSGRLIEVAVDYRTLDGNEETQLITDQYRIRQTFHEMFLYSSAFVVDIEKSSENIPEVFILKGAGWGHGVGYCQVGALGMALQAYSTEAILYHYYPNSVVTKIY